MGANAQTTVPKYTALNVLPAASMNISAGTGIPVFATTVTRDAAFGGANKVLAEGQTCYLESTNVVQYYDGAAWATVGPTAASTSGLVVVKAETAFTAQANVTVDNIFTSAYTNYKILLSATSTGGVGDSSLQLRVGGVAATTNYNKQLIRSYGSTLTTTRSTSLSSLQSVLDINPTKTSVLLDIFGPQLAEQTNFMINANQVQAGATEPYQQINSANHSTATAYDGIAITFGTNATGTYTVYGYGKTL